ncbi:hypothetical protein D7322_13575 [Sphingobacterium puteale]|uniref:Uncharacterized protein n=1 Tax=Sphingobacterium puteale TaxID=2420510 RepID=A0A420VYE3_9SPHI|nr:hypothetical protein D7322_13575 [Sphingobacterium puteale]
MNDINLSHDAKTEDESRYQGRHTKSGNAFLHRKLPSAGETKRVVKKESFGKPNSKYDHYIA